MSNTLVSNIRHIVPLVLLALITIATPAPATGTPLGSSFTYQGVLKQAGAPANGSFDFQFSLWDSAAGTTQVGSTVTQPAITVANGQFKADLNFGSSAFAGDERWLKIAVRPASGQGGGGGYTALAPLQRIAAAPYALHALNGGTQGPPGPAGPQSIATTGFVGGMINLIPGGVNTWVFAGPQATVTLQPGQRIIAWGSAPLELGAAGPQLIAVDVGFQQSTGGTAVLNASGNNYMFIKATNVRTAFPANGVINPGPGTWKIGVVVSNPYQYPLNANDYVNFTYMIVNQ